jgi:hyperosmotically inducible protein
MSYYQIAIRQDNWEEAMKISRLFSMKHLMFYFISFFSIFVFFVTGCAPLWVGAGAAGGYIIASDERPVGQRFDDSLITAKVKSRLLADSMVKGFRIDVDTVEREVTLTGIVSTDTEAKRAIDLARGVKGVVKVKNNIKVK